MSQILVTGGAGFIGSHLTDKLLEQGHSVHVIDNLFTGSMDNVQYAAEFYNMDISNEENVHIIQNVIKLFNIEYIFHLAAIPRTQYCVENPNICHDANVSGTLNILTAAKNSSVKKIIHSSSCSVYGIQDILPITEDASINLTNAYATQKYMQEQYIRLYATEYYNVPSVMLRYFNVYGTQRQSKKGSYPNVLSAFAQQKESLGHLEVTDDGEQSRDFVHVYDVVDANIAAMNSTHVNAEVFNIGTGKQTTINDIAKFFECQIEYIDKRPGEAKHLYADISKAETELKWKPKVNLEEGFKIYFNKQ